MIVFTISTCIFMYSVCMNNYYLQTFVYVMYVFSLRMCCFVFTNEISVLTYVNSRNMLFLTTHIHT